MAARIRLRPIEQQVVVVTGASSGIGLATARMAARRGAVVVLAARNERGLQRVARDIAASGGRAHAVPTDVADEDAVEHLAEVAEREFGRIDSWVNNASVTIYGRLTEIATADARRLFDVAFWGVVHGCQSAVARMRERGGAIVTVGSVLCDRALPLQGAYVAAKHAVKGYVDTLRMELQEQRVPIAVSLVKPSSVDTPFFEHARNYMADRPRPLAPVYAPEVVARTILRCATHRTRDAYVGGSARSMALLGALLPGLTDRYMERTLFDAQRSGRHARNGARDNLHDVVDDDGLERGRGQHGRALTDSLYTRAAEHPRTAALTMAGLGLAAAASYRLIRDRD